MLDVEQSTQLSEPLGVVRVVRGFVQRPDSKLLILRRSLEDTHNAGKWEAPGGKVGRRQSLTDAQKREIEEETGLRIEVIHPFVHTIRFPIKSGYHKGWEYEAHFSVTRPVEDGGVVTISHEHCDHGWVSYGKMLKYDLTDGVRQAAIEMKRYLVTTKN